MRTERLLLRRWRASDLEPFAAMNADPAVMEYFPATLSREQSTAMIEWMESSFEERGYGLWAVELSGQSPPALAGFVGLNHVKGELPFAPAVELGWRLAERFWGQGIACEAAAASIAFAFERLALGELVAYTAAVNGRSRRLMERLGMTNDPAEDFMHPDLPAESSLAPHVLYRLGAADWKPGGRPPMLDVCAGATPTPPVQKS
jgi:RimJ/RimL family protein N-acetyltransferase